MNTKTQIGLRLESDIKDRALKQAKEESRSVSSLLIFALKKYLDEQDRLKTQ